MSALSSRAPTGTPILGIGLLCALCATGCSGVNVGLVTERLDPVAPASVQQGYFVGTFTSSLGSGDPEEQHLRRIGTALGARYVLISVEYRSGAQADVGAIEHPVLLYDIRDSSQHEARTLTGNRLVDPEPINSGALPTINVHVRFIPETDAAVFLDLWHAAERVTAPLRESSFASAYFNSEPVNVVLGLVMDTASAIAQQAGPHWHIQNLLAVTANPSQPGIVLGGGTAFLLARSDVRGVNPDTVVRCGDDPSRLCVRGQHNTRLTGTPYVIIDTRVEEYRAITLNGHTLQWSDNRLASETDADWIAVKNAVMNATPLTAEQRRYEVAMINRVEMLRSATLLVGQLPWNDVELERAAALAREYVAREHGNASSAVWGHYQQDAAFLDGEIEATMRENAAAERVWLALTTALPEIQNWYAHRDQMSLGERIRISTLLRRAIDDVRDGQGPTLAVLRQTRDEIQASLAPDTTSTIATPDATARTAVPATPTVVAAVSATPAPPVQAVVPQTFTVTPAVTLARGAD